jgi:hypothetical protein
VVEPQVERSGAQSRAPSCSWFFLVCRVEVGAGGLPSLFVAAPVHPVLMPPLLPACMGQLAPSILFLFTQTARVLGILGCWACVESLPLVLGEHFTFRPTLTPCPVLIPAVPHT